MRSWQVVGLAVAVFACAACGGGDDTPAPGSDGGVVARDAALPRNEPCDTPGALEDVACGLCGTASRFCTARGVWEYGLCEGEGGVCAPGEERDAACGACGTQREVCTDACTWQAVGECQAEGGCVPGELLRTREGCATGQRDVRCTDPCTFEPVSECMVDACTTPGAIENVGCGACGTRQRFCTAAGEWEYGPCEGQGGCVPGTSDVEACGACGTQTVRCNDACEWVAFGECSGEGECTPGATTRSGEGCAAGETRPFTCSATCSYEATGACSGGTSGGGGLGERCEAGACDAGLECDDATGIDVCRRPCTMDTECVTGAWCLGGDGLCSDACTVFTDAGCPTGAKCDYLGEAQSGTPSPITVCSAVGSGRAGATCMTNSQCARGFSCVLDSGSTSGRCTQVCDATHPCPSGQTCSGGGGLPFPFPGLEGLGFCS